MKLLDLSPVDAAISIARGDTLSLSGSISQENGAVVDISASSVTMTIKSREDNSIIIQKTAIITDGPNGEYEITISGADWEGVPSGNYKYDIQITESNSVINTLFMGTFNAIEDITQ